MTFNLYLRIFTQLHSSNHPERNPRLDEQTKLYFDETQMIMTDHSHRIFAAEYMTARLQ